MKWKKYYTISIPDVFRIDELTERDLEEAYDLYLTKNVLTEPMVYAFLYALTFSPDFKAKLRSMEEKRLKSVKTFEETFSEGNRVNVYTVEGEAKVASMILDKFDVEYEWREETDTFEVPLSEAVLYGVSPNDFDFSMVVWGNRAKLILTKKNVLSFAVSVYINVLVNSVDARRGELIRVFKGNETLKKFVEEKLKASMFEVVKFPPCIDEILAGNVREGKRNIAIFSLIHFFKYIRATFNYPITDEEIANYVREANSRMPTPLPSREVESLIKYHLGSRRDVIYNSCAKIRREIPELCPYNDPKECFRGILRPIGRSERKRRTQKS